MAPRRAWAGRPLAASAVVAEAVRAAPLSMEAEAETEALMPAASKATPALLKAASPRKGRGVRLEQSPSRR